MIPDEPELQHLNATTSAIMRERSALLPGVLGLFGLQLLTVFTSAFQNNLDQTEQRVHLIAVSFVLLAVAMLVTPAAYFQSASGHGSSAAAIRLGRRSLAVCMLSLAIAIPLELFLIACVILKNQIAFVLGGAALIVFLGFWFVLPAVTPHR